MTSDKDFASDVMKNFLFHCEKSSRREGSDKFYKGFYSTWNSDEFWKIAFLVVFQYFLFSIRLTRSFRFISFKFGGKHRIFVLFPNSPCFKLKSRFQNFLALKDTQEAMVKKRKMATVEKC